MPESFAPPFPCPISEVDGLLLVPVGLPGVLQPNFIWEPVGRATRIAHHPLGPRCYH
jgi:hypothetical protein